MPFDPPDESARLALWRHHLPETAPLSPDVDLTLRTGTTRELVDKVLDRELDGAFVGHSGAPAGLLVTDRRPRQQGAGACGPQGRGGRLRGQRSRAPATPRRTGARVPGTQRRRHAGEAGVHR